MAAIRAVHECLFCPQVFDSAAAKDDHVLEHFAQETCTDCNQNLIRIGSHLYIRHSTVTCIKNELKSEENNEMRNMEPMVAVPTISFLDRMPVKGVPILQYETTFNSSNPFQFDSELSAYTNKYTAQNVDALEVKAEQTDQPDEQDIFISDVESILKFTRQSNSNETNHKKSTVENRAECDICGKYFHPYLLRRHKRDMHSEAFVHTDDNTAQNIDVLEVKDEPTEQPDEQESFVSDERPYFQISNQLNSNKSNHCKAAVGNRSMCDICGKYICAKSLKRHKRAMHSGDSESNVQLFAAQKRFKQEHLWKRNRIKNARDAGLSYVGYTGVSKPAIEPNLFHSLCSDKCRLKCSDKISSSNRQALFKAFYSLDVNGKNLMLFKSIHRKEVKQHRKNAIKPKENTFEYFIKLPLCSDSVNVCKRAFCSLFRISGKKIAVVQWKVCSGEAMPSHDKRGRHSNRPNSRK